MIVLIPALKNLVHSTSNQFSITNHQLSVSLIQHFIHSNICKRNRNEIFTQPLTHTHTHARSRTYNAHRERLKGDEFRHTMNRM